LSKQTVRFISAKKREPEWLLEWRLDAHRRWTTMMPPAWAWVSHPEINFRADACAFNQ
jgi:Fe-S cluster assembly protein SufB